MRWAMLLLAGVIAACSEPPADDEPAPSASPTTAVVEEARAPAASPVAPESLVGEYRVTRVDGLALDLPHAMTARITSAGIHLASDCVNLSWSYFFEGPALVMEQVATKGCGRNLLPSEQAVAAALDAAVVVGRTPANGVEFSGGGRSVLLSSP